MSLKMRIYYNAIVGGLGGLASWLIIGSALRIDTSSLLLLFVKDALLGSVVGICIGGAIGSVDGILSRSARRAIRGTVYGAGMGLIGGMLGLVVGELIYKFAHGGVIARSLGWAIFGLLVGTSEGLVNRSPRKSTYGALGGTFGGLIGGSTYERTSVFLLHLTHNRDLSLSVGSGIGLIILGACIGSLVGLVEFVLKKAWLKILNGRLEGREFIITKRESTLGKADDCDVVLPGDPQVAHQHAVIRQQHKQFVLVNKDKECATFVNKQRVTHQPLNHGDRIQIGKTLLLLRMEGKT